MHPKQMYTVLFEKPCMKCRGSQKLGESAGLWYSKMDSRVFRWIIIGRFAKLTGLWATATDGETGEGFEAFITVTAWWRRRVTEKTVVQGVDRWIATFKRERTERTDGCNRR